MCCLLRTYVMVERCVCVGRYVRNVSVDMYVRVSGHERSCSGVGAGLGLLEFNTCENLRYYGKDNDV